MYLYIIFINASTDKRLEKPEVNPNKIWTSFDSLAATLVSVVSK